MIIDSYMSLFESANGSNQQLLATLRGVCTPQQVEKAQSQYQGHDFALVERLAYWSFQGYNLNFDVTKRDLDDAVDLLNQIKVNSKISGAGYAALNQTEPELPQIDSNAPIWLLRLLITCDLGGYWSFIVPATLNLVDSEHIALKIAGARFVQLIAQLDILRLKSTGLVPVLQDALKLLLFYLPPSTDPEDSSAINSAAQAAMLELASCRQDLNLLMVRAFAALEHAHGHLELTIGVLTSLTNIIKRMGVLVVAHLATLVNIFNAVVCDPFADLSPELLTKAVKMMALTMQVSSERVGNYRYNIMLGVEKTGLWDTDVGKELEKYVTKDERKQVSRVEKQVSSV